MCGWSWGPALLVILVFLFFDAGVRWREIQRLSASRAAEAPAPMADASSPTGYAFGQRRLVIEPYTADGYQWIMQAQKLAAGGGPRIRHVDWDNAPAGREAHWDSGLVWWIAGLGWIHHVTSGKPLPIAVEEAAHGSLTILLALLLVVCTPVVARRFGSLSAVAFAGGFVFFWPVYVTFVVGSIDHHGPVAFCAVAGVLCLAAGGGGWRRGSAVSLAEMPDEARSLAAWLPGRAVARRWFVASGIFGAAALWINAATEVPILVAVGLAAVMLSRGFRRTPAGKPWRAEPGLWRLWGFAGALGSVFFYLLEYFPDKLGWRLEVNHPLYALAWLGAGDLLSRLCSPRDPEKPLLRSAAGWLPALLAVGVLPLTVLLTRERVFAPMDPFLWRLHADYIQEFQPLVSRISEGEWPTVLLLAGYPLLVLGAAIALLASRIARPWKALIVIAILPVLFTGLLSLGQMRWLDVSCTLAVGALVIVLFVTIHAGQRARWNRRAIPCAIVLGVLLVIYPIWNTCSFMRAPFDASAGSSSLMTRNLAWELRRRLGSDPGVIVAGFTTTSRMIYFGGLRGLGTGYWENVAGLHAMVEIQGAATDEEALALIRKHGVTHVVDDSVDAFAIPSIRLLHGMRRDQEPKASGFLKRLEDGGFPTWIRPVLMLSGRHSAIVYEVDVRQTPQQARVRNARFFFEKGMPEPAKKFIAQALAANPDDPRALIVLADIQAAGQSRTDLNATLRRVDSARGPAGTVEPEDSIGLAVAELAADDEAAACEAAKAALARLDERSLRRLSAVEIRVLLQLSRRWDLRFRNGLSEEFAAGLLPKVMRPAPGDPTSLVK